MCKISNFKEKVNLKHCGKYDYSLVTFTNLKNKIKIICPIHRKYINYCFHLKI